MRMTLQLLVVIGLALTLGRAQAETVQVDVRSNFYRTVSNVPGVGTNETSIHVGDTVQWTWRSGFHSVTSDTNVFASMLSGMNNFIYVFTFNTPGDFPYHCAVHGVNMSGVIHVRTQVSGVVHREDCISQIGPLTFTFHPG